MAGEWNPIAPGSDIIEGTRLKNGVENQSCFTFAESNRFLSNSYFEPSHQCY